MTVVIWLLLDWEARHNKTNMNKMLRLDQMPSKCFHDHAKSVQCQDKPPSSKYSRHQWWHQGENRGKCARCQTWGSSPVAHYPATRGIFFLMQSGITDSDCSSATLGSTMPVWILCSSSLFKEKREESGLYNSWIAAQHWCLPPATLDQVHSTSSTDGTFSCYC